MTNTAATEAHPGSADDTRRILGDLDDSKLLAILALRPTVVDVEQASVFLAGDPDVFGAGQPPPGIAGDIIEVMTSSNRINGSFASLAAMWKYIRPELEYVRVQ
jgi:hypothetical protein